MRIVDSGGNPGQRGPSFRPEGCQPDLPTLRQQEMPEAARVFGNEAPFIGLADISGGCSGSPEAGAVRQYVDDFKPDIILTFDPRHGRTGLPDHRGIDRLPRCLALGLRSRLSNRASRGISRSASRQPFPKRPASTDGVGGIILLRDLACHRSQMRRQQLKCSPQQLTISGEFGSVLISTVTTTIPAIIQPSETAVSRMKVTDGEGGNMISIRRQTKSIVAAPKTILPASNDDRSAGPVMKPTQKIIPSISAGSRSFGGTDEKVVTDRGRAP